MQDYIFTPAALNAQVVESAIAFGDAQYQKADILEEGYPGIELVDPDFVWAKTLSQFIPEDVEYDYGPGTGTNYIVAPEGKGVGRHSDKPLYKLDANYQVLPEYNDRVCVVTVVFCVQSQSPAAIKIWVEEDVTETITLSAGDVLVIGGGVVHELLPTEQGTNKFVCSFYCSN